METTPDLSKTAGPVATPVAPGERVQNVARETGERFTQKRGPGRPPKHPHVNGSAKAGPVANPPRDRDDVPAIAPGVVERAVAALCTTADRFIQRRVHTTALILTKEKGLADGFAAEVAMTPEERGQIAALSEAVAQQYSLAGQHAPAVLLGVHVIGYGVKVATTLRQLEQIARFNARQSKPPPPAGADAAGSTDTV